MNQMVRQTGPGKFEVVPQLVRDFKIVNRPDMGGMNVTMRGEPNDFYLNTGGGRFLQRYLTTVEPSAAEQQVGCRALQAALAEHARVEAISAPVPL